VRRARYGEWVLTRWLRGLTLLGAALTAALPGAPVALAAGTPTIAGCPVLPADSVWNTDISSLPVNPHSGAWLGSMSAASTHLHPDFGSSGDPAAPYGIPYIVVDSGHPRVSVAFDYAGESDPGPYPFGTDTPIEGGAAATGDRHALMLDHSACSLYELYNARYSSGGSTAGSGAVFNLVSNQLRPAGWTSADAAGLPILPGLLRPEEVSAGYVGHAIRFTAQRTDRSYLWPARHQAGAASDPTLPPMGARFRLAAGFDEGPYSPETRVVLEAMKHFGMILADNGSNWFFQGAASNSWGTTLLSQLKQVPAAAFEAVDESSLMISPDSGQARQPGSGPRPPASTAAVMGVDGGLYTRRPGEAFAALGGVLSAAPAMVAGSAGGVFIGTGSDQQLWVRGVAAGWQPLSPGGAPCADNPAAAYGGGVLYVACERSDRQLWRAEVSWGGNGLPQVPAAAWSSLGGVLNAGPAIAVSGGQAQYFVVGSDGGVFRSSGGGWSSVGWGCIGHPAAAADVAGNVVLACHGSDGQLWYAWGTGASVGAPRPLGGALVDGVGIAVQGGRATFYVEGTDSGLYLQGVTSNGVVGGYAAGGGRLAHGAGGGVG
jgi:hypothetical protein